MDAGATQVGCLCVCQAPLDREFRFLPPQRRNCLPPLVDVNVVRPRGFNPRLAGGLKPAPGAPH